jgi:hypothetical protein
VPLIERGKGVKLKDDDGGKFSAARREKAANKRRVIGVNASKIGDRHSIWRLSMKSDQKPRSRLFRLLEIDTEKGGRPWNVGRWALFMDAFSGI